MVGNSAGDSQLGDNQGIGHRRLDYRGRFPVSGEVENEFHLHILELSPDYNLTLLLSAYCGQDTFLLFLIQFSLPLIHNEKLRTKLLT